MIYTDLLGNPKTNSPVSTPISIVDWAVSKSLVQLGLSPQGAFWLQFPSFTFLRLQGMLTLREMAHRPLCYYVNIGNFQRKTKNQPLAIPLAPNKDCSWGGEGREGGP